MSEPVGATDPGEDQHDQHDDGTTGDDGTLTAGAPDTFRVRCPDCGPQIIAVSEVRYVETGADATANRYVFACPECGTRVRRPAGPELSEILRRSGVATLALHRGPGEAV